ncbi:MAG: hypothetical protein J0L83_12910 [Chitinophagales bacterium]|jgi:hypothetical protein|nr:hypothetical protein [Chitinophagales bacterium]
MKYLKSKPNLFLTSNFIIALLFLLASCAKKIESADTVNNLTNDINSWLQKQRIKSISGSSKSDESLVQTTESSTVTTNLSGSNKNRNIDHLQKAIFRTKGNLLTSNKNYNIYFLQIHDSLKVQLGITNNSVSNLIIIFDKNDKLLSGYISVFYPEKEESLNNISSLSVQKNLLDIFNNKKPSLNGEYKTFGLGLNLISEIKVKDGKVISAGYVSNKSKKNTNKNYETTTINCTDWYLITTYYYSDGTSFETETYLGRTCTNSQNQEVENPQDDQGGGGGGVAYNYSIDINDESEEEDLGPTEPGWTDAMRGIYFRLKYKHQAKITYSTTFLGYTYIDGLTIYDTTVEPVWSTFTTSDPNITGTRKITLLNHYNYPIYLAPPLVLINWSCSTHGLYQRSDGTNSTQQWNHSRSRMY